jgi:2-polyprenyl-6-methoxyphenol hydroxylase-like FAD-dependent oxidoreductase
MDTEVLVVGAGPTGLTLAAGLLRRGIRVRIIDKADRASPHSKAITLWPRALEAFQSLGIGKAMFDLGVKLAATSYYTGDRRIGRVRMRTLAGTRFPVPITLPQVVTERLLRDVVAEAGAEIEFGRALESIAQDGKGVSARLDGGEIVRAEWAVGCDGAHSTVREQAGIAFEGATYPQTFLVVDGEYDTDYAPDESYYLMGPAGVIVVVGLPGGLHRTFASLPPGESVHDAENAMRRVLAQRSPLRIDSLRVVGSGIFQTHRKMVERMRVGRVLLAGDAAHIHSPAGGLGLNTGVQDANSLAWRLAGLLRAGWPTDELDAWENERLFVANRVLAETDAQTRLWLLRGWRRLLRDVAIGVGLRTGLIERILSRRMAQFDLVLPPGGAGAGRLRPGGRMPDLVIDGDRRLHDQLSGHLLVAFGGPVPAGADAVPIVVIDDPKVRRTLGVPRDVACLVRPDGVIAAVARGPAGLDQLRAQLPSERTSVDELLRADGARAG